MRRMKVVIAEDDNLTRNVLVGLIQSFPSYQIVGEAKNGEELIKKVIKEKPDIVLTDIIMPTLNGMDAVKTCKKFQPNLHVIFITGREEFAIEAFTVSAIDYILKPVEQIRLYKALEIARDYIESSNNRNNNRRKIAVKEKNTQYFIPIKDILFIEKESRKTIIHTISQTFESSETLSEIEVKLNANFYQSHRSNIININHVSKIEAIGESYLVYFFNYDKTARISKQKISIVHDLILNEG